VKAIGAAPIGAPGCPEFAFWTASMESVRIVVIARRSRSGVIARGGRAATATLVILSTDVARPRHRGVRGAVSHLPSEPAACPLAHGYHPCRERHRRIGRER